MVLNSIYYFRGKFSPLIKSMTYLRLFGLLTIFLAATFSSSAQWTISQTGVSEHINGLVFVKNKAIMTSRNNVFFSSNGGYSSSDWEIVQVNNDPAVKQVFDRSIFSDCITNTIKAPNRALISGTDTLNGKAVIFLFNLLNKNMKLLYTGSSHTSLNALTYNWSDGKFIAVGDSGLVVSIDTSGNSEILEIPYADNIIDVTYYSYSSTRYLCYLSSEKMIMHRVNGGISINSYYSSDRNMKAISTGPSGTVKTVGNLYNHYFSSSFSSIPYYDTDSLEGNDIIHFKNFVFVGTPRGIYRTGSNSHFYLEKLPHTENYHITSFTSDNDTLYAVAEGGYLLRTDTIDGPSILNLNITTPRGVCNNSSVSLSANYGSAVNCSWYVDGNFVGSGLRNISTSFPDTGTYELMIVGVNAAGYRDTANSSFISVLPPNKDIGIHFSDTLLCRSEQIKVELDSSERSYIYSLYPVNGSNGSSLTGKGQADSFISHFISISGKYFVKATHETANCVGYLNQSQQVTVEHTKAEIYTQSANVFTGDTARFFDKSLDAQNYRWTYSPTANWNSDGMQESEAVYSQPTKVKVKLLAWSDDGCSDSTESEITSFYNTSTVNRDSCWNVMIKGSDTQYYRYSYNYITPSKFGGFLIDGNHTDQPIFSSRNENHFYDPENHNGFVAKYDSLGVLKWKIKRTSTPISYSTGGASHVSTICEDSKGNPIITGALTIRDSRGNEEYNPKHNLFSKLNPNGELIFEIGTRDYQVFTPWQVFIDPEDNVYCLGQFEYKKVGSGIVIERNGDSIGSFTPNATQNDNFLLVKLGPNGTYKWARTYYFQGHNNTFNFNKLGFDNELNAYFSGSFRYGFETSDPPGGKRDTISHRVNGEAAYRIMFAQKIDRNGHSKWINRAYTLGSLDSNSIKASSTFARAAVTSKKGDTYLAGINNAAHGKCSFVMENADGSTSSATRGQYYIMKIDSSGMTQWIEGTQMINNYFGYTSDIIIENESTLYVLGKCMNDRFTNYPSVFTSTNGDSIVVNMVPYTENVNDYFIANYDTAGVLKKIMRNGVNHLIERAPFEYNAHYLLKQGDKYIVSAYSEPYPSIGTCEFINFGNVLIIPGKNRPSIVTSFKDDCALVYYPNESCVNKSYGVTQTLTSCGPYKGRSGTIYQSSGSFTDIDTSILDCDTIYTELRINLKIDSIPVTVLSINACNKYVSEQGNVYDSSGVYYEIFKRAEGCDSVLEYHLSINKKANTYITDTVCRSFQLHSGVIVSQSGLYLDTLRTSKGCDSVLHISLTIIDLDTALQLNDTLLISMDQEGSYAWLDCEDLSIIPGEDQKTFRPFETGSYAVIITRNGCVDTSECISVDLAGINKIISGNMRLIPNPTANDVKLVLDIPTSNALLSLHSSEGRLIYSSTVSGYKFTIELPEDQGIYYVTLKDRLQTRVVKVLKI